MRIRALDPGLPVTERRQTRIESGRDCARRTRRASIGHVSNVIDQLQRKGVRIPAPGQVFIDSDVDPDRIAAGAILYPGTRLLGKRTFLAAGAAVGTEGPATLDGAVLGREAAVASGYVRGAVLLQGAKLGGNAHVRDGTLLEEEASTRTRSGSSTRSCCRSSRSAA